MQPFLDSTEIAPQAEELKRRMARDGYLFLRQLLSADMLEELRLKMLAIGHDAGWVVGNAPLARGVADLEGFCVEPEPKYMQVYERFYALPEFHAVQHHPDLLGLLERMVGEPVMPHPRIIARIIFPQRDAFTTPAHQDFVPVQGAVDTYTAWIPLSDMPDELGGLQLAAGSHQSGIYDFRPALGAGGMEIIDPLEGKWVHTPFEQGDVLLFHSMTVHKGMPNTTECLRLSLDARYQKITDPIEAGSLEPHSQPNAWERVYADWPSERYQYYWKQWDLHVVEFDERFNNKRDAAALEMAASGDQRARSALQRIVARNDDTALRERASTLLYRLDHDVCNNQHS